MKISEFTTDKAADVLCELTPYIGNIATDEELLAELRNAIDPKEVSTPAERIAKGLEKIGKIAPIVLKKRKADVFGILAVLNDKSIEEIGKQNILATMSQIREIIKDKDLIDFFKSCVDSAGSE